jgi:hypothetical protein
MREFPILQGIFLQKILQGVYHDTFSKIFFRKDLQGIFLEEFIEFGLFLYYHSSKNHSLIVSKIP